MGSLIILRRMRVWQRTVEFRNSYWAVMAIYSCWHRSREFARALLLLADVRFVSLALDQFCDGAALICRRVSVSIACRL
jgi:hypothetical protein